jgi:type II secretory pathway component PulF
MLYTYEASESSGRIVKGTIEGPSKEDVLMRLSAKGLVPIRILSVEEKAASEHKKTWSPFETIKPIDRIVLVRNMSAAIKAGLNLLETLEILAADATKTIMKNILLAARSNLQSGQPLYTTFAQNERYFPAIFSGLVKAGEASGNLETTLDELGKHMSRDYNLSKKVRSALMYPLILFVASILIVIFLIVFILPRISLAFARSGIELPLITRVLIGISRAMTYSIFLDLGVIAGIVWFFMYLKRSPRGKKLLNRILFRIPVVREFIKKLTLVRITRTMGILISSGIPITETLKLTGDTAGNDMYKTAFVESLEEVKGGVSIHSIFKKNEHLFPKLLVSMVMVGEKTGTLENILKTFSEFYEEEVDSSLKDLTTFIEPVLLLFMGIVVGVIALAILLPIYQMVGQFV